MASPGDGRTAAAGGSRVWQGGSAFDGPFPEAGVHPQMALIQVSKILYFTQIYTYIYLYLYLYLYLYFKDHKEMNTKTHTQIYRYRCICVYSYTQIYN
jgi:hypothetical protein